MSFIETPIYCCMLGAFALQLLQIVEASRLPATKKPDYKSWEYYIAFAASIIIAGIIGYIYFGEQHTYNRVVYFHTGASSPLLMRTLASTIPEVVKQRK